MDRAGTGRSLGSGSFWLAIAPPDATLPARDFFHRAAGVDRSHVLGDDIVVGGELVAVLDEQPLRFRRAGRIARKFHSDQRERAVEPLAMKRELEIAPAEPVTDRVFLLVCRRCGV